MAQDDSDSTEGGNGYKSPEAVISALTDFAREEAKRSKFSVQEIQRFICFDRLLTRMYSVSPDWTLKGAFALLTRDLGNRATLDIDVHRAAILEKATNDLFEAAELDMGDYFKFIIQPEGKDIVNGAGRKFMVTPCIGEKRWSPFVIDLVGEELSLTGTPEKRLPKFRYPRNAFVLTEYKLYPLVDHTADKVFGIMHRPDGRMSTRVKDLIDLVTLATSVSVQGQQLRNALEHKARESGISLFRAFEVPRQEEWSRRYRKLAIKTPGSVPESNAAELIVKPLLDPVLSDHEFQGVWSPSEQRWTNIPEMPRSDRVLKSQMRRVDHGLDEMLDRFTATQNPDFEH